MNHEKGNYYYTNKKGKNQVNKVGNYLHCYNPLRAI